MRSWWPVLKAASRYAKSLISAPRYLPFSRVCLRAAASAWNPPGTYHEVFAELAHQLGFLVFLLNPKDTRHYAKAVGLRGKTDRVDAELIARMIAHEHTKLHAWIPPTPQQRELDRLIKRRATLVSLREALEMSLHELDGFGADLKALRTRFNQLIARIDLRVKALVEASPERKQNYTRLRTITGVGPVIGTALVNTLERVPLKNADAFVAFTGLDPRPDDSGQHRGKRRLSKRGPAELRRLLYLAAMALLAVRVHAMPVTRLLATL